MKIRSSFSFSLLLPLEYKKIWMNKIFGKGKEKNLLLPTPQRSTLKIKNLGMGFDKLFFIFREEINSCSFLLLMEKNLERYLVIFAPSFRQSNRRRKMDTDFFFFPASAAAAFFRPIGA